MDKKKVVIVFLSALLLVSVLEIFTPFKLIGMVMGYTQAQFGHPVNQIDFSSGITGNVNVNGNVIIGGQVNATKICFGTVGSTDCYP